MKKKEKKKKNSIYNLIGKAFNIISILFITILLYSNVLPAKYFIPLFIVMLIFNLIGTIFINIKRLKKKFKIIIAILFIVLSAIMIFASCYLYKTVNILKNNLDPKYKTESYSVIVLKDNKYENIKDLNQEYIGYYINSEGSKNAINILNKLNKCNYVSFNSIDTLIEALFNEEIDAIVVEKAIINIINDQMSDFSDITKTIYTFDVKIETKSTLKEVNVLENSFAIYISGIDTYGEISSVSRSDVNIVAIINPNTNQILLISIPRDYYVQLHGTKGYKDKLTHAGIYGINMSIQTLEDLLDTKINYYLKVNFTSVIDIVDALGGLDVYSEYTFTSYSGFKFKKGLNSVNGEQALDFVRTRKAFSDGDRQRGKNQQALLESIVRKLSNKTILTKYNSLLDAINGKYQTNMSYKQITSLIRNQLNTMPSWNLSSYSLTGSDSSNYTYTYNQLLYVMEPDINSLTEVKSLITNLLNGNTLENSYENISGSSYKVSTTKIQTIHNSIKEDSSQDENNLSQENNDNLLEDENSDEDNPSQKNNDNLLEDENSDEDNPSQENNDKILEDENNDKDNPSQENNDNLLEDENSDEDNNSIDESNENSSNS